MIQRYILNYHTLKHNEVLKDEDNYLLKHLLIFFGRQIDITLNFSNETFIGNSYNTITKVINNLIKKTNNKSYVIDNN